MANHNIWMNTMKWSVCTSAHMKEMYKIDEMKTTNFGLNVNVRRSLGYYDSDERANHHFVSLLKCLKIEMWEKKVVLVISLGWWRRGRKKNRYQTTNNQQSNSFHLCFATKPNQNEAWTRAQSRSATSAFVFTLSRGSSGLRRRGVCVCESMQNYPRFH